MMRNKKEENQRDSLRARPYHGLASRLMQGAFLLAGLCLTVFGVLSVHNHINTLIEDEYERVSARDAESAFREILDLEESFDNMASLLAVDDSISRATLAKKARDSFRYIERFDQIIWLYQPKEDLWAAANIYTKDTSGSVQDYNGETRSLDVLSRHFSLKVDKDLLNAVKAKNLSNKPGVSAHTDLRFVSEETGSQDNQPIRATPFALIRSIDIERPETGMLIGVATLAPALSRDGTGLEYRISARDFKNGHEIYETTLSYENKSVAQSQAYEFSFAGQKWDIRTKVLPSKQIMFLRSLPFFAVVIGFMITAFGTLYIRSNSAQAMQVSKVYKELEKKTVDLEAEVQKRTRLNMALAQAEHENKAIIDAVSDIIFELDTSGRIMFLSASWRKVTGFEPEQSYELDLFKMLHSQDQELQRRDFDLLVKGQKQAYRSFARLRTADGTFRAVELALSMMRQDRNKDIRVVGTITDVEERRRAERALSEAEKKYRAIVENAAGGIYQLTPEGLYLSANPAMARILGYESPEDLLRHVKNANEMVYVDTQARQRFIQEVERRGAINSYETEVLRKDGTKIWVNENIRAVKDDKDNTLYYEGSLEDTTMRKKSEIAMREAKVHSDLANRAKSEFLSNMSHELRTPLNAIIGFSEIIKDEAFGPIENRTYWDYAKDIHNSGKNLLRVINEILEISKIDAGERQLNEGLVDLNGVVESCLALMSNKIEANDMMVSNLLREVPQVIGEERAIKQILMNLLSNAIKFTPDGGRVTITAELDKQQNLRVSVTDTGVGLDEMELEKALSPFGQVDSEHSRSGGGTGLGLTLVDALIKLHGGAFELFSQKGIGTTATIVFPKDRVTVKKTGGAEKGDAAEQGQASKEDSNIIKLGKKGAQAKE